MKYITAFLILCACDSPPKIDSAFHADVEYFEATSRKYNHPTSVGFNVQFGDPQGEDIVGRCEPTALGHRVVILQSAWQGMDRSHQRALIFHELGHCALSRAHDYDATWTAGEKVWSSLMYPSAGLMGSLYRDNPEPYEKEMFK